MNQNELTAFIQEKQKEGRINTYQGDYLFEQSLLAGSDLKETLKEFNLLKDFEQFTLNLKNNRETLRQDQQKSYQLSTINDKINSLQKNINDLQNQINTLNLNIEPQRINRDKWIQRLAHFPDNPNFLKQVKEIDQIMSPISEKICLLETSIEELQQSLEESIVIKQTIEDN